MSEGYRYNVTVYLPEDTKSYECKSLNEIDGGVKLFKVKDYKGSITILNTPVIITTEGSVGLGAGLIEN